MQALLTNKLDQISTILKAHKVSRAYAFGSVCTDRFTDSSDIDILVAFDEGIDPIEYGDLYWSLDDIMPKILGRPVDLMTERQLRNPYFVKVMNRTKTSIYGG
jgi:predicted nucleotidyltransferase